MAQLLFSTSAFRPDGSSVEDVPILLDARMRLIEPACAWLMHVALVRGRTRSSQTWRTYGEALYDWWQTLEANGWKWDEVGAGELAAYRDQMLRPRRETGQSLARSTINGRLRTIARFYRWSVAAGLMTQVPFAAQDIALSRSRPLGFLAHVDASGGRSRANELTVRHTFAAAMLRFLQREARENQDLNPLLTLQVLLGHADLATTSVYLRVVETDLSVIEASIDELYDALL